MVLVLWKNVELILNVQMMLLIVALIILVEEILKIVLHNHNVLRKLPFYVGMEDALLKEANVFLLVLVTVFLLLNVLMVYVPNHHQIAKK
jgi:hypothetical protein